MIKLFISFTFIFTGYVLSGVNDIKRLKNCYAIFTNKRIPRNHTLLSQVKADSKTGDQACKELLASAFFNSSNEIAKDSQGNYKEEASQILHFLNLRHRSFYKVPHYPDLPSIIAYGEASDVYDANVPAYFWSYALFKPSFSFSNIMTMNNSLDSIRYSTETASRNSRLALKPGSLNFEAGWSPPVVDTGKLVGIKNDTVIVNRSSLMTAFSDFNGTNANKHFGAGVIGSQVYLISNVNKWGSDNIQTGGIVLNRKWSESVIKDFLCREIPVLRVTDVQDEVQLDAAFPFRKSASCMQCHSSMDPMAANIRNLTSYGVSSPVRPLTQYFYNVSEPSTSSILPRYNEDDKFHLRPPKGRMKFRSYDGTLMSQNTNNLSELGAFIASTNDFYACAAKKYYKVLTGIEVSLHDIGDPDAPILNSTETFHRNKVIELGLALKTHQSLPKLIEDIIKTDTFLDPSRSR